MANNKLETIRHSLSHIMAAAVQEMFPEAKFGIGPAIADGFYYDFDLPRTLIPEDLPLIEEHMKKIVKDNTLFEHSEVSIDKAIDTAKKTNQKYKVELLSDLKAAGEKKAIFYRLGKFIDLCAGPHVKSSKNVGAFKLTKIAGAYWRGDEKNPMLQRIYGVAFATKKELDDYLKKLEKAEKRDHRKLGKELDLFSLPEEIGGGLSLWHPKGAILRQTIEDFWKKEHQNQGYELVYSPHIANLSIWKKSGHWDFYRENMYSPIKIEEQEYVVKPMNCPFHILIYKSKLRSYKDLPIRYAELGTVYRYERSGVLHGLTRVRGFTQDDAHIFCQPDQLEVEVVNVLKLADFMLKTFGFKKYQVFLSTRPEKSIGSNQNWKHAETSLKSALKKAKIDYKIDPGEGVFYGPKIDIKLEDSLGRDWQGPTIQVDFNFPEKFDVTYIDKDGKKVRPVMIHRTVLGSMERFVAVLTEHYAGAFPIWLTPVQTTILPISEKHLKYAKEVVKKLKDSNIRYGIDDRDESIGKKIREAELQKIPYMLVVGDKEEKSKAVSVRKYGKGDLGSQKLNQFITKIVAEIEGKK